MGRDQDTSKRSRIVVPTAPRATVKKAPRATKTATTSRAGMQSALIDAAIIVGATLFTTLFLLLISGQLHDTTSSNLPPRAAAPVVSFAPTPTPPKRASPTPTPTPSTATPTPTPGTAVSSDSALQAEIMKKIADDPNLASLVTATVSSGKVTLTGTVPSEELKDRVEKLARAVKGIKSVDNQIAVGGGLVRTTCGSGWVNVC